MNYQEAYAYLAKHHQEHLLRFYDTLNEEQQNHLLNQIAALDLTKPQYNDMEETVQQRGHFEPLGAVTLQQIAEKKDEYEQIGLDAIRQGKLGCVLLAGGQGTRLGFDHPKGMYNMGLTRELYIFQCLFENLKKNTDKAGCCVPLYIMTSSLNNAETKAFLKEKNYFGYPEEDVFFFIQEQEAAVDMEGKILLAAKDSLNLAPNGNGGWFCSMANCGMLESIQEKGIEWLNIFAVDNVLQQIADPVFLGATIANNCKSGGAVVSKADPDERVGVLCLEDGQPSIVEYYEMTEEMRTWRDENGDLTYRFGVILNYLFRVDSLMQTLDKNFPLHRAFKKLAYTDEQGNSCMPEKPNGYKFETLVLDMVHMQESCLAYEVDREKAFAPVKNAVGIDSVETARELLKKNDIVL